MAAGLAELCTVTADLTGAAAASIVCEPDLHVVSGTTRGRAVAAAHRAELIDGTELVVEVYDVQTPLGPESRRALEQVTTVAAGLVDLDRRRPDPHEKATFVHDVKTPLTAIVGFAGLLAFEIESDPTAAAAAERVEQAGQDVLAAVDAWR